MAAGLVLLGLAACTAAPMVEGPVRAPAFEAGLRSTAPGTAPGQCWHSDTRPALFETVTEQVMVTPEQRDATGTVIRPATFRSETRQSELRPRQAVWFRIPCAGDGIGDPNFIASLQRALKARGLFGGAVTGVMDPATEAAVRHYQSANGLDSAVLSLAAGQALGLIAISR